MTDGMIKDLVVNAISDYLIIKMINEVSDDTKASIVKPYRFQYNPLEENVYCWISTGDPKEPFDMDSRVSFGEAENLGMRLPAGEVGGGHLWWRRGTGEVGCYWVRKRYEQDVAAFKSHQVLGRAMHWIERTPVSSIVDEFGERAIAVYLYANNFYEGGGNDQFYWRGSIHWQILTERLY